MAPDIEKKQLKHLQEIADEVGALREHTTDPKRSFLMGMFQGAGIIVGSILALAALSWLLSVLGVVPGFDSVERYLNGAVTEYQNSH
jgi:hypothetical protein